MVKGNTWDRMELTGEHTGVTMMTLFGSYLKDSVGVVIHATYLNSDRAIDNLIEFLEVAYEMGVQRILVRTLRRDAYRRIGSLRHIFETFRDAPPRQNAHRMNVCFELANHQAQFPGFGPLHSGIIATTQGWLLQSSQRIDIFHTSDQSHVRGRLSYSRVFRRPIPNDIWVKQDREIMSLIEQAWTSHLSSLPRGHAGGLPPRDVPIHLSLIHI